MRSDFLVLVTLIGGVYVAALYLVFPGYFDPLYPIHADVYFSPGLSVRNPSLNAYFDWPRPIGYFVAHLIGLAGVQGSIAILILVTIVSIVFTVKVVERFTEKKIPFAIVVLYAGLVFTHPQFYINYIHDTLGTLSYMYLILGLVTWQMYVERPTVYRVILCTLFFILVAFTKETYFVTALVFIGAQGFFLKGTLRRVAILLLISIFIAQGVGIYWNLNSTEPFMRLDDLSTVYRMDFSILSMVNMFWSYSLELMTPGIIVCVAVGLYSAYKSCSVFWPTATIFLGGICALFPHVPLPDHFSAQYAWTAVPLTLTPVLFLSEMHLPTMKRSWCVALTVISVLVLSIFAQDTKYEKNNWFVKQERINRNLASIFPKWRNLSSSESEILVAGISTTVNPFYNEHFVVRAFGADHKWTVTVGREIPKTHKAPVSLVHPKMINLLHFDRIFSIDDNGNLAGEWSREEIKTIDQNTSKAISEEDIILFPALKEIKVALSDNPKAWYRWQEAGLVFWKWGLVDKSESMFQKALIGEGIENPYPYYYLGCLNQWKGEKELSNQYYNMAVERESKSPNSIFQRALEGSANDWTCQAANLLVE